MHRFDLFLHPRFVLGFMIDNEIKGSLWIKLSIGFVSFQYEYFSPYMGAKPYEDL